MTPRLLLAGEWGMTWRRGTVVNGKAVYKDVTPPAHPQMPVAEVFVHHTAGRHPDDAATAARQLNDYAQRPKELGGKGYMALDYSMLVHRNPATGEVTVMEARGAHLPAATRDRNNVSKAVCLLGYFDNPNPAAPWTAAVARAPHPDELAGVAFAIRWMMDKGWVKPDARILAHRDNPAHPGATSCPGAQMYPRMDDVRRLVTSADQPTSPGIPQPGEVGPGVPAAHRPTLRRGATGPWVKYAQGALAKYWPAMVVDGIYGTMTERVVIAFQTANKLPRDGEINAANWPVIDLYARR